MVEVSTWTRVCLLGKGNLADGIRRGAEPKNWFLKSHTNSLEAASSHQNVHPDLNHHLKFQLQNAHYYWKRNEVFYERDYFQKIERP